MFEKKQVDMTNGPLTKNMILFAIPVILTGVMQLLFNALDLIFAGQFCGTESMAAVGSTTSLTSLITALFTGLGVGVNVVIAHSLGSKDFESTQRVLHTSIPLALAGGLILFTIGFFASAPLLAAMKTDPQVISLSTSYMRVYFLGSIPMLVYNFMAGVFRANGDSTTPMKFLILSGIINLCLKPLFVLVFKMDVMGLVTSTAIAHFVSAVLSLRLLMKRNDACRFEIRKMRFHKKELLRLLQLGLPAGIQSAMFCISNVLIQSAINPLGPAFVSGNAAANNIESALNLAVHAVGVAAINFVGQNVGIGNIKRVKKVFFTALLLVTTLGVALCTIVYFFRYPLLSIYNPDKAVIEQGMYRIMFVCVPYFLFGIQDTMANSIRGMGVALTPTIISFLGVCVFRVSWQYTVYPIFDTVESLFIAYPISWILTGIAYVICYTIVYSRLKKRLAEKNRVG